MACRVQPRDEMSSWLSLSLRSLPRRMELGHPSAGRWRVVPRINGAISTGAGESGVRLSARRGILVLSKEGSYWDGAEEVRVRVRGHPVSRSSDGVSA